MQVMLKRVTMAALLALSSAQVYAQEASDPPPPQQQPPGAGGRRGGAMARPQRDAQRAAPVGTGTIAGRVVAADTGRPVKRARVVVASGPASGAAAGGGLGAAAGGGQGAAAGGGRGGGMGGGRPYTATTDEQGRYTVGALPAGTYNVTASRTGFVDAVFGQRRALRPGTPIALTDGQQLTAIDLTLSRGGVVTGRVLDEDGEPLASAAVTVLRQQYVRGEKQLSPAGTDQSDDRGQYRVFGLPPGDYFVSAAVGGVERMIRQFLDPARPGFDPAGAGAGQPENTGYAATYYPGVTSAGDATRVKLAAAQEATGIDFQIQIVTLATVKGIVVGGTGTVMLLPQEGGALGGGRGGLALLAGGLRLRAETKPDGTFSIANVTPGRYTIVARVNEAGSRDAAPRTAVQPLTVTGEEVTVTLTPAPGVQVSGTITLESSGAATPNGLAGFRINTLPLDSAMAMPRMARPAEVAQNGEFTITDVMAGRYDVRATGPRGWMMKSVFVDGRDVTDQPLEIKTESVTGLNVIFTNRIASLRGAVRDTRGGAAAGLTVVVFPADETRWTPQSRQILTARTDASGAYTIAAMPEGDYLAIAVDDVEQGEWFDPAFLEQLMAAATKVTLGEGENRTQDLKAPEP